MKTGCQWRELSIKEYFGEETVSWQTIYYYFHKWSVDGSFKKVWIHLLKANKSHLDLSSVQLDGSHTPCKRGGVAVGYQGRKSCKTSNSLFLCDNNGQMLAVSSPQSGEHNDLFNINDQFIELLQLLESATISHDGIFLNADPGFDSEVLIELCQEKKIELNENQIQEMKRNGILITAISMKNYIKKELESNMQTLGWMHSKHYLLDMKRRQKHG